MRLFLVLVKNNCKKEIICHWIYSDPIMVLKTVSKLLLSCPPRSDHPLLSGNISKLQNTCITIIILLNILTVLISNIEYVMCDKQITIAVKIWKSRRASCSDEGLTLEMSTFSNFHDDDNLFVTHFFKSYLFQVCTVQPY